jgi:hypothetical protein
MRRREFHNGDGSHKRYETREEFEERRDEAEFMGAVNAIVEENTPDDSDADPDATE